MPIARPDDDDDDIVIHRQTVLLFSNAKHAEPFNLFVCLFNGISTLFRFFNARAILLEEQ